MLRSYLDRMSRLGAAHIRHGAQHFARGAFHYHHVRRARNEHASGGRLYCDIVRAAVAFDVKLFNFECLCLPSLGRGETDRQQNRGRQ